MVSRRNHTWRTGSSSGPDSSVMRGPRRRARRWVNPCSAGSSMRKSTDAAASWGRSRGSRRKRGVPTPSPQPCHEARALIVVGHGVRERQLWGPVEVDGAPVELTVRTSRFRCRKCRAVMVVVPVQTASLLVRPPTLTVMSSSPALGEGKALVAVCRARHRGA